VSIVRLILIIKLRVKTTLDASSTSSLRWISAVARPKSLKMDKYSMARVASATTPKLAGVSRWAKIETVTKPMVLLRANER
jgi:hypothetical protein